MQTIFNRRDLSRRVSILQSEGERKGRRLQRPGHDSRHASIGMVHLPVTSLEFGRINTYHRFKVPKKRDAEKSIIFRALIDMDRRENYKDESDPSTNDRNHLYPSEAK